MIENKHSANKQKNQTASAGEEAMRHFHGIKAIDENEKPRTMAARRAIRRAVINLKRGLILAGCAAGCALIIGCGPDPVCQATGWLGEGQGGGHGDYERGGQIHRDFEGAARWCEQVQGTETGTATADCIEEAMFE